MILLNEKMIRLYNAVDWSNMHFKNRKLLDIVDSNFLEDNECFLLEELFKKCPNVRKDNFHDKTAYECFVNSFYVSNYTNSEYIEQALFFLIALFKKWNKGNRKSDLKGIVSMVGDDVKVWFYVVRDEPDWFNEKGIDSYQEPVCILTSRGW